MTIPAGTEYYTDPVELEHAAGSDIAVSLRFAREPDHQTSHKLTPCGSSATTDTVTASPGFGTTRV